MVREYKRVRLRLLAFWLPVVLQAAPRIEVTIANGSQPLTGHLILAIAKDSATEPRFQISEIYKSAQAFGLDVENLAPGKPIVIDETTVGYPLQHLSDLPEDDYYVQGVLNVYQSFHLSSGAILELPPDRGEGQQWNSKPGNPYSKPQRLHFRPHSDDILRIALDRLIPADSPDPVPQVEKDGASKWLKYVRVSSPSLSRFWGREIALSAWILLPDGWADHPNAHYPLIIYQDHFHPDFGAGVGFHTTPHHAESKSQRNQIDYAFKFYQDWTSGRLPRAIILYIQDANPYFDDSYNVNSANLGPYGDAITQEVIPEIEKQFRAISAGWARATFGGSTGGWESLASQIFYPDFYNGTWSSCPDPVDFHAYQNVDLYNDQNAYFRSGPFGAIPIAEMREPDGSILANMEPANRREYVFGTHGRSAEQFDIWQAVFSPAGPDGYPKPVYDKRTGVIDPAVVRYWHDHYDLTAILERDWPTLGPKLEGKLHLAVGDGDTWFLNNAVHRLQIMLAKTRNPHSDATFDYGPGMPHCYTGEPNVPMSISGHTEIERILPLMIDHMLKTAPKAADTSTWRY
jgi:hypothetical protein